MKAKHAGSWLPFEEEYWKKKDWFDKSFNQAVSLEKKRIEEA